MFISTMDTHHPYGHVSKSCKVQQYKDGANSMLNAVACADELIARFIKQIQDSPYGKNTIIVVCGGPVRATGTTSTIRWICIMMMQFVSWK